YDNRIELLSFQTNNWGNSFTVEVSTIFLPKSKRNSNFCSGEFKPIENANVWDTNLRYRLKGMYDGWFYYTDVYKQKILAITSYNAVSEKKAKNYSPAKNEKLIQKANDEIYCKVCEEVNKQMVKAFKWWDAFEKNNKLKMKLLEIF
ncbi:MAG: hypothetical protein IKK26_06900, partial [Clostridia bacterium]|nr:hypothetical protein [Clostridia bacterium]